MTETFDAGSSRVVGALAFCELHYAPCGTFWFCQQFGRPQSIPPTCLCRKRCFGKKRSLFQSLSPLCFFWVEQTDSSHCTLCIYESGKRNRQFWTNILVVLSLFPSSFSSLHGKWPPIMRVANISPKWNTYRRRIGLHIKLLSEVRLP